MVISAGDLPMEYLGFLASSLNKPVVFVFGNHNLKALPLFRRSGLPLHAGIGAEEHTRNYYGSTYAGDTVLHVEGILIAGLGGSMRYNDGENQFTETQMFLRIVRLIPRLLFNRLFRGRYLDVLLTHASPFGIHDKSDLCHTGFKSFLWFMRVFKPRYLLHGHIHLYDLNAPRITRYEETEVINVYDHFVLEYEPHG